jgi:hypothetical protein
MSQSNSPIAAFGEIIFIPMRESVPSLPNMKLLFFNEKETIISWRAVCIDLEIDACGDSKEQAWENLKDALSIYIAMERKAAGGSIVATARNIIETVFDDSKQKRGYIDLYRQAEKEYSMRKVESKEIPDPIKEEKERLKKLEAGHESIRFVVTDLRAA